MKFQQNVEAALGVESEEYSYLMNALDAFNSEQQGLEALCPPVARGLRVRLSCRCSVSQHV